MFVDLVADGFCDLEDTKASGVYVLLKRESNKYNHNYGFIIFYSNGLVIVKKLQVLF